MEIEAFIQKILGKKEFKLSKEVPLSYLFYKGFIFILGSISGLIKRVGINNCGKNLILGKNVVLINKNKMNIGDNVRIEENVFIDALSYDGVYIGDRVKIGESSKVLCTGTLSEIGKGLSIGNDTSFAENTFFGAAGGIKIGNDVISGQNVRFHAENHNYQDKDILIRLQGVNRKGIKVGSNVWIGSGVVFLDGCNVGDDCVIAANSVVSNFFDKGSVIGGTPAKVIKKRY